MIQIHLTSPIGTAISVAVENAASILPTVRQYGKLGYTSGEVPSGGHSLPLANADDFDFALIGAHPYINKEGEACIMHRGQSYKRRELEAVENKKMSLPKIVKYSRGARPTDLPHVKEGEDGGIQYVTLLTFRGGGKKLTAYALNAVQQNAAD
ncbi:single-stranded DNA-binding protein [Deinococcus psychrotolerans]|uniref:Single-stranded DNA-binding protein n=1 Tax=Deinococcus psychrotolerans TaxID=2489213 RepID=A0A3G8YFH0_9DEIO|nr:single-stranded DNA-binding protein [Deinococcus psychrotolerans]AZI44032.1 single-stranded DNA-binding protein [Deinococcus psychrotolerans]